MTTVAREFIPLQVFTLSDRLSAMPRTCTSKKDHCCSWRLFRALPELLVFPSVFQCFPHIESRSHPSILCMSQHVSRGPTPRLLRLWPMPLISDRMRSWLAPITVMWWGSISRFVSYLEFQRGRRSHVPRTVQTRVSWSGLISDPQQRSWAHP